MRWIRINAVFNNKYNTCLSNQDVGKGTHRNIISVDDPARLLEHRLVDDEGSSGGGGGGGSSAGRELNRRVAG